MNNPLIWVLCVGALCAAMLSNELTSFICFAVAFILAALGNIANVWLAVRKAKRGAEQ
jgi:uncharacterized membrane protein YoaK (UPF0700 family)